MRDLTEDELDVLLERYDQTEPKLQRQIVGKSMLKLQFQAQLSEALDAGWYCCVQGKRPSKKLLDSIEALKKELA